MFLYVDRLGGRLELSKNYFLMVPKNLPPLRNCLASLQIIKKKRGMMQEKSVGNKATHWCGYFRITPCSYGGNNGCN